MKSYCPYVKQDTGQEKLSKTILSQRNAAPFIEKYTAIPLMHNKFMLSRDEKLCRPCF